MNTHLLPLSNLGLPNLMIQTPDGKRPVHISEIVFLESARNYTFAYLADGTRLITSKTIGLFELPFAKHGFIRINKSIITHLSYITESCKNDGYAIRLRNGQWHTCSRRRTPKVRKVLKQLKTL
ncbi:LytR/AlgR family response regulator transcription factor [Runella aurantiaca]|uniref:LytTR family transcriptional regulator n=1 Tax=Runella aurantiaca TaxID=2282308 RepID=A0A369I9U4_9BACT|nr:LytTR family DNA-binding domain-containing protein [Runella aurantiaca]RDB05832.1 LytTR family transcriptional regulator [Runella aurantiaca]